jgi:peptidoglycan/LPS O-acetylase OafA/YrhL
MSNLKYRPDIDGLRAIAVISVVAYHAFPKVLYGGFIGVDIFFVISGFLISSIIFSGLENNNFSLGQFYLRRIRRILPSLLTVGIASLILGWLVLLPNELEQLGRHIAAAAVFIINFVLSRESGYFDNPLSKPMLHLWSLSVEEQFYFFWPLLLILVWKRKFNFLNLTILIAIISFFINIYLLNNGQSTQAFYWPMPRFWELMSGGILAYVNLHHPEFNNKYKNLQSLVGFFLLLLGFWLIKSNINFPGWWALLPVLGAVLIISAGNQSWLNRKLLSNKPMVWIGLISYPLYLWHWVLLSFSNILLLGIIFDLKPSTINIIIVLLSIALAYLTYTLIEKPLRFSKNKKIPYILLFSLVLTGLFGFSCIVNNGYKNKNIGFFRDKEKSEFSDYFDNSAPEFRYEKRQIIQKQWHDQCGFYNLEKYTAGNPTRLPRESIAKECYQRDNAKYEKALMLWGDSHAQMLRPGLQENLPKNWQILQVTSSNCPPKILLSQEHIHDDYCLTSNWFALETIKKARPNLVVLAQNEGHSIQNMEEIISTLVKLGVGKVIFVGPTPTWANLYTSLPNLVLRRLWHNTPERTFVGVNTQRIEEDKTLKQQFKSSPSHVYVSLIDYFCNHKGCLTRIGNDKKLDITTFDYGHLTPKTSGVLARDLLVPTILGEQQKLN